MLSGLSDPHKARVRSRFGSVAARYATSEIHARGRSLDALIEEVRPQPAWTVADVATGAGHAGFTFAPHVERVVSLDFTETMLHQVSEGAVARDLSNVRLLAADAESLPLSTGAVDAVTCRLAFHHFANPIAALAEFRRVLKPGGVLGLTDNITADEPLAADYYNAFERVRDGSRYRVLSFDGLTELVRGAGFTVDAARRFSKEVELEEWADRQRVSVHGKASLRNLLEKAPDALRPMLAPRAVDGTLYFTLWEAVVVARSTDS